MHVGSNTWRRLVLFGSPGWKQVYAWNAMDPRQNVCVRLRGFDSAGTKSMALAIPNTVSWHGA